MIWQSLPSRVLRNGSRLREVAKGRVPLRTRLVASIIAIVGMLAIGIGAISVVALRSSLINQVDAELKQSVSRAELIIGTEPGVVPPGVPDQNDLGGPRQAPGTVTAVVLGTKAQAVLLDEHGQLQALNDDETAALTALLDARGPRTIDLGSGLGSYRVESVRGNFISGEATATGALVVGLPLKAAMDTVAAMVAAIAAVSLLGLALAIGLSVAVVRSALGPLERMANTALRIAKLPLGRGEVALSERVSDDDAKEDSEVGRVGAAFNRMLDNLSDAFSARQQSESKVRQFVADASHELRTPLASIRGYSELMRRMRSELPSDVAFSLERIDFESLRMTTLVDELLLLARLDENRGLAWHEVDLTRVVLDAANKARIASETHTISVDVPHEIVIVQGDVTRLNQLMANLLLNARTHTPEGTHVRVELVICASMQEAKITVNDDGPGIDQTVLPVIFERFARADISRSRQAGSTGLGLAIAYAIVQAHRGTLVVDSSSRGASFYIRLPVFRIQGSEATVI